MEQEMTYEDPKEVTPETPPEIAPEIIQEAMETGWIPEDQFKGDKTKWRPANEWVERGRTLIPIIKSQVKDYKIEIETLKRTVESQKATTERLLKMSEKTQERAYEQAKRELTAKQMEAVRDGDIEKWQQIETEKDKLEKPEPIEQPAVQQSNSVFETWKSSNDWYTKDSDMMLFADSYGQTLVKQNPNMMYDDILKSVAEKVKTVFPHKFENPNRNQPSAVDSSSQRETHVKPSGKSYADLPSDAKSICDRDVQNKLYKTREEWVKEYFEG